MEVRKAVNARRWLTAVAGIGGGLFLLVVLAQPTGLLTMHPIEQLLFFGIAVTTPLAMRLCVEEDRNGQISQLFTIAIVLQPIAILAAGFALILEPGLVAIGLASLWFIQTFLLAFYGLTRWLRRPVVTVEEICIDAGLLYVPISAVWLLAYCLDYALLSFDRIFVLLTAVHFTFISLGALVIAGMVGRELYGSPRWRFYRRVAWALVISPLLVAVGITISQYSSSLILEAGSVVLLAGSFLLLAMISFARKTTYSRLSRLLILISTSALIVTMGLALGYSVGRLTGWWALSLTQMIQWHGWLNAVAFTFCGLLAWNLIGPISHIQPSGIPFSHIPWKWHMGPDFFQRINGIDNSNALPPTGIVDNLMDYARQNFDPGLIAPEITSFYEHTADHELLVYPEWQPGFHFLARIYKQLSRRIGQMNFPLSPDTYETHISSAIVPLKDELDGRQRVRGWVRTYTKTKQAVYVAAYSSHAYEQCRYMNIAFPLPFGNLTSILRLEALAKHPHSVLLTSYSQRCQDQGVYFASRLLDIRLPINETISVFTSDTIYDGYPSDFPIGTIIAEHKMWLLGMHCLTLHYSIKPTANP
ncbi:MAG: YndJ family protein [Anaerolineae bacterium]|nr:YndJ family protein [Anaerolineae bacterium]MCA9895640.1 YndJ family protein [Anaerolineae bacterium]